MDTIPSPDCWESAGVVDGPSMSPRCVTTYARASAPVLPYYGSTTWKSSPPWDDGDFPFGSDPGSDLIDGLTV